MPLSHNAFCGPAGTTSGRALCATIKPIVPGRPPKLVLIVIDIVYNVEMLALSRVDPNSSILKAADEEFDCPERKSALAVN